MKNTQLRVVAGRDVSPKKQSKAVMSAGSKPDTKANAAMNPIIIDDGVFESPLLQRKAYYADDRTIILNMDVSDALQLLVQAGMMVNCIVTCSVPDDHIAPRRSAFFMARSVLRDIQNGVRPC